MNHGLIYNILLLQLGAKVISIIETDEYSSRCYSNSTNYGKPQLDNSRFQEITIGNDNPLSCFRIWSKRVKSAQICCNTGKSRVKLKCLPHFIVAGVQKAGTTVLAALLSTNGISGNEISFSKKKEIHFFDNNLRYSKGARKYLTYFNEWKTVTPYSSQPPVYGEATPFYLASRDACQRIASTLPGVRMIVVLREPVARAYSEYHMKKRYGTVQYQRMLLFSSNSFKFTTTSTCFSSSSRWNIVVLQTSRHAISLSQDFIPSSYQ